LQSWNGFGGEVKPEAAREAFIEAAKEAGVYVEREE
jgi:hypothetical protein